MSRRSFFKNLLLAGVTIALPVRASTASHAAVQGKLLQTSPVAGFQYHQGEAVWAQLSIGAPLQLIREPENKYDTRAVRIELQGHKLGYLPRLDNATISQLMDRAENLQAYISGLKMSDDPWQRVEVEVRWMI